MKAKHCWTLALVLSAGCGRDKEFAETAIAIAEREEAPIRVEALKLVPAEVSAVDSELARARDRLERGDYRAAMKLAETAASEARGLEPAVDRRRTALTHTYQELAARVPAALTTLEIRLDSLARSRSLPPGLSRDSVARLRTGFPDLAAGWREAADLFSAGELELAARRGAEVDTRIATLLGNLGGGPARH
jgi:hypothetical protein